MNQLKPYFYWIACGIALLVLIIVAFVWTPSDAQLGDPYAVKKTLDTEYAKLEKLDKRAKKGDPAGVFDAENKQDIDKLTNDYLLTGKWLDVLTPHVSKYEQQLGGIQKDLIERSAPLHQEVSANHDLLGWYIAYENKTGALVTQLLEAKAIVLPERVGGGAAPKATGVGVPAGGPAGAGATAAVAKDVQRDPATDAPLRDTVGLFTRGETHPAAEEHPSLTTRFRIVERIAQVVLASAAESLPNPVIDPELRVSSAPAFVRFEWAAGSEALQPPVGNYATSQRCSVTFQGSESALLALMAGLESMEKPVVIVLGSTLSRRERSRAGAHALKDAAREPRVAPMALTVDLAVLD
ncbi:MAG: hypothetical protein H0W72_10665, partial [Planctomycetes bacterium]|nr:hypothetical protein [Planctomycetota bacterium]